MFSNLQVQWNDLPQWQETTFQKVQPAYLTVLRISWSIGLGILLLALAAMFVFIQEIQKPFVMGIAGVTYVLLTASIFMIGTGAFKRKAYAIREKDILYKAGWIFRDVHIVPISRIQHCVIHSGPIERKFGLASLHIYTAANDVLDISIKGISIADAEQLKEFILSQIHQETAI